MCGRYSLYEHLDKLESHFDAITELPDFGPRYNAAPSQYLPVVYQQEKNRLIRPFRWGLISSTASQKPDFAPINARAETVDQKWPFNVALSRRRRCLIPASGFFEWKGSKGNNQPYHIVPESQPFFAFAGLYDIWQQEQGEGVLYTYTIITTAASSKMKPLHHRMPAILLPEEFDMWLDTGQSNTHALKDLLAPFPGNAFDYYPVSQKVNSYKNEDPSLIEPVDEKDNRCGSQASLFD